MKLYNEWDALPNKVYYSEDDEILYTSYEIYCAFKNSDDYKEYKGDFYAWFSDCIRYDVLRPIEACTVLWIDTDVGECPLFIEGYHSTAAAWEEVNAYNGMFDDGFMNGPRLMSVVNLNECTEEARDWLTEPAANYGAQCWEDILYGTIPEDVLTIHVGGTK